MNLEKLDTINRLTEPTETPVLSFFMPTWRAGKEVQQNAIRFKNLVARAEEKLQETDVHKKEIESLLQPVKDLIDADTFWQHQDLGLALFCSPQDYYYFNLPENPAEEVIVSDEFYVKPLISAITEDRVFYLLSISQGNLRLYRCSRYDIEEVNLQNVPLSIEEMMQYEDPEKSLQYHTGTAGTANRPAQFHGQGTGSDASRQKKDTQRFFHMVDHALNEHGYHKMMKEEDAGLILAGIDELIPMYREANSYPHLLDTSLNKNPDEMDERSLHETGWKLIAGQIDSEKQQRVEKFLEMRAGDKTSMNPDEIIKGSVMQRIDTLFLDPEKKMPGWYDHDTNTVHMNESGNGKETDLLNFAVLETLRHNGEVITLNGSRMLPGSPVAAIFRF